MSQSDDVRVQSKPGGRGSLAKRWSFTLPNPTDVELDWLRQLVVSGDAGYLVFGHEVAPSTGTVHAQGYVELMARKRLSYFKGGLLRRAHLEVARGTAQENTVYCSKDGRVETFGSPAICDGKPGAAIWNETLQLARAGKFDDIDAGMYLRYFSTIHRIASECRWKLSADGVSPPSISLRRWQSSLLTLLRGEPSRRSIIFVVDEVGGAGKSTFAEHIVHDRECNAFRLHPGRGVDLAYVIDQPYQTFLVDCPRGSQGFMPCAFLESLKDGFIVSTKYETRIKQFMRPHLVVFTNSRVPNEVLSVDRICEYLVSGTNEDWVEVK